MKARYAPFYAVLLMMLTACATLGVPPADTFNKRLAAGYTTVTGVRNATFDLRTAGRITAQDARNVEAQADNARTGLDLAREIYATNPPAGDAKLDAVVTGLTALQAYLQSRTKGVAP